VTNELTNSLLPRSCSCVMKIICTSLQWWLQQGPIRWGYQ